jgi:hypothetical protein
VSAIPKEAAAHFELAERESKPLADVILPGTADFRSQQALCYGTRYTFGPGALAYTNRALKAFCSSDANADGFVERKPDGVVVVIYWSEHE